MRLLIVAFSESIHTARWVEQLEGCGWEIFVFPSVDNGVIHKELRNVTVFHSFYGKLPYKNKNVKKKGIPVLSHLIGFFVRSVLIKIVPDYYEKYLKWVIKRYKPDIIHSMETQHAGYLVDAVKKDWKGEFPTWLLTVWGSDIYHFRQFSDHKKKIQSVLSHCDYYLSECNRDVCLARDLGLKGKALPTFPVSGGFDLDEIRKYRQAGPTSKRKLIMLKGYQGWAGRAIYGLHALERCADLLKGYKIMVFSIADANSPMPVAIEEARKNFGLDIEIVPLNTSHNKLLELHGHARVSIGLSISDGISVSLLEAIVMGSLPIQTSTACADEWITDGRSGIIVPPEDTDAVEVALRRALEEDSLVDQAQKKNYTTANERLNYKLIRDKSIKLYKNIIINTK